MRVCVKVSVGVPFHLNLFVKLSIILSTGGHLLMIDAAPLNVMDGSAATRWDRGETPQPPSLTPPPRSMWGRRMPRVHRRRRNKATFNLSPINNVQLRRPPLLMASRNKQKKKKAGALFGRGGRFLTGILSPGLRTESRTAASFYSMLPASPTSEKPSWSGLCLWRLSVGEHVKTR